MLIEGRTGSWEIVIGLEVHAQVVSQAKLFSGAATAFGADPNTQVSFVDAAFPGMLPVINRICVEQGVKTGLGLNGTINLVSVFDRKNYFYADLPAGYQISQYTRPIVSNGKLAIELADGATRDIGITRLHMEQDAGKSLHDQHPAKTYVDLNRAGVALMEIVSEPDLRSPEEAGAYLRKLRSILRYLGTCDGNMEEGSMRCDANVSVRKPGDKLGTRCEIKNVNSIRYVMQAIEYEARRQVELIEGGGTVKQETRLFDPGRGETRPMRSKEEAHDYRYFPDPDLLPLVLESAFVERLRATMPELPDAKAKRYVEVLGMNVYNARVITAEKEKAAYFESMLADLQKRHPNMPLPRLALECTKLVMGDISSLLNEKNISFDASPLTPVSASSNVSLQLTGTISGRIAKDVLVIQFETGEEASMIVAHRGLQQVTDTGAIEAAVAKVIADNAGKVADYRAGKQALFGWFVGQVMKATQGKANPAMVNQMLKDKLSAG
jgi:aspartyl-tRNA(Asn)/glutamyl-tRNA(Gln) amidotransferase subunit B